MSDPTAQYTLLVALFALAALVWLGCALSTFGTYRAFRQMVDLGWTAAYLLLALLALGDAFIAYQWRSRVLFMSSTAREASQLTGYYWLRFVPFELVAAFLMFGLLRMRRKVF